MGQNAFRQALQDRTGLEPIMDVRDSAVNSLHLRVQMGQFGASCYFRRSFNSSNPVRQTGFDSRASGGL